MKFENGRAYSFKACLQGGGSFLGVMACREDDGVVAFVKAKDLIVGRPIVMEGREIVFVNAPDGQRYMASAACVSGVDAALKVLEEVAAE